MPAEEGKVVLELEGPKSNIDRGLEFIKGSSIQIEQLGHDINIDRKECVDCGACTSVCLSKALVINDSTHELEFDRKKCILCGLCVGVCPVRAIKIIFETTRE